MSATVLLLAVFITDGGATKAAAPKAAPAKPEPQKPDPKGKKKKK